MPEEFFSDISSQDTPPVYNFFNGSEWVKSTSGKTIDIISPIDGTIVGKVQSVTEEEVDAALAKAASSQQAWEATPLNKRATIVHLAADWIRHFEEYLTTLLAREVGKTIDEAKSEIKRTADLIDYYADEVQSIKGQEMDSDNFPGFDKGRIAVIERVAYGTVVAIAPFNYPVNLSASKLAPALLMGNSIAFKPPTQGSISGLHLAKIFQKAGVPAGVMCCLTGTGSVIGDYLVSRPSVSMIAFTGSSETGAVIASHAKMKSLLFECGGNNPVIVLPDADMSLTAREIIKGAFSYAGQRCTGIKYVMATADILETIKTEVLKQMPEFVHMGDPRDPSTKLVGPLVSVQVAQDIEGIINEAIRDGAKIETGGKRKDAYIEPTVLSNVTPKMKIVATEVFGPVVSFIVVKDVNEAISIINASSYGLQASVFTKDEGSGLVVARQINVGSIQINGSPQRGPDHFPFLGVKKSGVGVQGVRYSLEAMSRLRPIVINKPA